MSLVWGDAAFGNGQVPLCEAGKEWQLCHREDASKCVVTVFKYNIKLFERVYLRSIAVLHGI